MKDIESIKKFEETKLTNKKLMVEETIKSLKE